MNIVIVGLGKYGVLLTNHLAKDNHNIVVIDSDRSVVDDVVNKYDVIGFVGNGASYNTLEEAGVNRFDLMVATTSTDEINILTCLVAKKLKIKQTIARIRNPEYAVQAQTMQEELGISLTINPDYDTAVEIFRTIRFPSALTVESFANGKVDLVEFKIDSKSLLSGKNLQEVNDKYQAKVLFSAVVRDGQTIIPSGNFIVKEGDHIYVTVSSRETTNAFKKLKMFKNRANNAIIIGGGKIGYYLTQMLLESGVSVKIIDSDKKRCLELAKTFPKALVLNGEATDQDLLLSEGIKTADVLVALTGQDETNIIVSTYAKDEGCKKVITKISKGSYDMILNKTGLESVVEPKELFANNIIRYVRGMKKTRGSEFKTLYRLVDEKVEAAEFFISKKARYTSKPLKDLKIKKNVLVASIIRKGRVIIPGGLDTIEPLDTVIIVTSDLEIKDVSDILE